MINESIEKVIDAMALKKSQEQMYHCLGVIEYMRRRKAIALVGNVCSGKTTVLKIVSMALKHAYGVILRTCMLNPMTFTKEEFYGPINAFDSAVQKD